MRLPTPTTSVTNVRARKRPPTHFNRHLRRATPSLLSKTRQDVHVTRRRKRFKPFTRDLPMNNNGFFRVRVSSVVNSGMVRGGIIQLSKRFPSRLVHVTSSNLRTPRAQLQRMFIMVSPTATRAHSNNNGDRSQGSSRISFHQVTQPFHGQQLNSSRDTPTGFSKHVIMGPRHVTLSPQRSSTLHNTPSHRHNANLQLIKRHTRGHHTTNHQGSKRALRPTRSTFQHHIALFKERQRIPFFRHDTRFFLNRGVPPFQPGVPTHFCYCSTGGNCLYIQRRGALAGVGGFGSL